MALRFFADHCVSNLIIHSVAHAGHQVLRLKEHLPVESPDSLVIAKAQQLDTILPFPIHHLQFFPAHVLHSPNYSITQLQNG